MKENKAPITLIKFERFSKIEKKTRQHRLISKTILGHFGKVKMKRVSFSYRILISSGGRSVQTTNTPELSGH